MHWPGKNGWDIILSTDNQKVLGWAESIRARAPASGRLLRALNFFCLAYQVGILPTSVRRSHNSTADGLAVCSETSIDRCETEGNTTRYNPTDELRRNMELAYKKHHGAKKPRILSR